MQYSEKRSLRLLKKMRHHRLCATKLWFSLFVKGIGLVSFVCSNRVSSNETVVVLQITCSSSTHAEKGKRKETQENKWMPSSLSCEPFWSRQGIFWKLTTTQQFGTLRRNHIERTFEGHFNLANPFDLIYMRFRYQSQPHYHWSHFAWNVQCCLSPIVLSLKGSFECKAGREIKMGMNVAKTISGKQAINNAEFFH